MMRLNHWGLLVVVIGGVMDPVYVLNQRFRYFSECLRDASAENVPVPSVEEWLHYWNDDDTYLGNLQNIEHWLSAGKAQRELR